MSRTEVVAAAHEAIQHGSKSFRLASGLFDRTTRERAWLLYCWCRHCDDLCDGQSLGHAGERTPLASMAEVEALTRRALAGETTGQLPFDALATLVAECPLPERYVFDHLKGFALDAEGWQPQTEEDLLLYCYYVAGAVGCMMAIVMGVSPDDKETLERASHLGLAFQLSNIARDVADDHRAGRCYIPGDWLAERGIDREQILSEDRRADLVELVGRMCDLAERYELSARSGAARLPFRSRWAVLAAGRIYGAIGRQVAERGPAAWDERVVVRKRAKLGFLFSSLFDSARAGKGRHGSLRIDRPASAGSLPAAVPPCGGAYRTRPPSDLHPPS